MRGGRIVVVVRVKLKIVRGDVVVETSTEAETLQHTSTNKVSSNTKPITP